MQPFFTFYGGKWRLAPRYPAPQRDTIVEPFAGSAGYAVRHNARRVVLVDLDEVIVGIWSYLIAATEREVLALPDVPDGCTTDDLRIPQEARDLIGFWISKGAATPGKTPSAWIRAGFRPASSWGPEVRQRIASQLDQIRHWIVLFGDYTEAPNLDATWFIDPPYADRGSRYRRSAADIDFNHLADWSMSRRGQLIVCENEGATWLPFEPFADAKTSRSKRSVEVAYLRGVA